jgi:hypothetical protein
MPQITELGSAQLTETDSLTVELAVRGDGPALVKITGRCVPP